MKRGDIYLVKRRDTLGAEITKTRPAVIVSNDALNASSKVVEVVYLTTQPRKELPTHATIQATGVTSTAICEQIDSVSLFLLCAQVGTCSEEEMADIDRALMSSLGLIDTKEAKKKLSECERRLIDELQRVQAERDRYAKILDLLLAGGGVQG